jgi:hypothetical protein
MKRTSVVLVMMVGCASPVTERVVTQSINEQAATFRFSGSLPVEGDTCRQSPHYRSGLCGARFHGYFTIPSTPDPNYGSGYYQTPYDEQGVVTLPWGMVLEVDGKRPRIFYYVTVSIGNDVTNWLNPDGPLVDTFHLSASANLSNDGFDVSFTDPTGTAIDNDELMPDPARFAEVCSDSLGGCPLVVGDSSSDFLAMDLQLTRSPVAVSVPRAMDAVPYFYISAADWLDADHTTAAIALDVFDEFTFATSTCDVWLQFREAEGASPHAVQGIVSHRARGQQHAVLTIETGAANPERQLRDANLTCGFARPREPIVESTTIWSTY